MYAVIDRASRNILGEYATFVEAESLLLDLVGQNPAAASDIEIIGPKGRRPVSKRKLEQAVQDEAVASLP